MIGALVYNCRHIRAGVEAVRASDGNLDYQGCLGGADTDCFPNNFGSAMTHSVVGNSGESMTVAPQVVVSNGRRKLLSIQNTARFLYDQLSSISVSNDVNNVVCGLKGAVRRLLSMQKSGHFCSSDFSNFIVDPEWKLLLKVKHIGLLLMSRY